MPIDGECIQQIFKMIPKSPVPNTDLVNLPANPLPGCCSDFVIKVLADDTGEAMSNDISGTYLWCDPVVTAATMKLKKFSSSLATWEDADDLDDNDYGVLYPFGSIVNSLGQKFIAYKIDWAKVLDLLGEGSYKVAFSITAPVFGEQVIDSYEYCLKTYTPERADGTIRLEYFLNGVIGDYSDDTKIRDFANLNWYNQLRVPGYFGYPKSTYKSEDVEYENGQSNFIEDEQTPLYKMKIKMIPFFMHEIIRTDYMQADRLLVTDYNSRNNGSYISKGIRKESGYEPNWHELGSEFASVELQFRNEFNNYRKLRY